MLRQLIRWIATSLVSIGMIVAVEPVIHVNVEHLAKQRHWDEFLAKWWPEVPDLSPLLQTRWFWLCFGSSLGVALALWIVRLFPEKRPQVNVTAPAAVLPSDPQIAPSPIAGGAWFPAEPPAMTEYDRDRRRREIDELIASITAGKTLKSLRDAGALALLLQSGICPRRSTQELADEITNVRNSMVNADNERITIASKFPENLDTIRHNRMQRPDDGYGL